MERSDLQQLSKDELIELVLRLQRPAKTSKTSSQPPFLDKKERRENSRPGGAKKGHKGHWREMCADPDALIDHVAGHCPGCGAVLPADIQVLSGEYERIELPEIRPHVERHRRFGCRCPGCGVRVEAELPKGIGGTPFGLKAPTHCELARAAQAKIGRARDQLLTFAKFPGQVEATNNGCERALRPAVIQRKVTNGYRAMWAAKAEAAVRTTVDTARIAGKNPFQTILQTIA